MLVDSNSCENCAVRESMRIVRKQTVIWTTTINRCEFIFNNNTRKIILYQAYLTAWCHSIMLSVLEKRALSPAEKRNERESAVCPWIECDERLIKFVECLWMSSNKNKLFFINKNIPLNPQSGYGGKIMFPSMNTYTCTDKWTVFYLQNNLKYTPSCGLTKTFI